MWRPSDPTRYLTADAQSFIHLLDQSQFSTFFDPKQPLYLARAPGRLDLMGGIADYSGSLVLQMPIAEATFAAAQTSDRNTIRIISGDSHFECSLDDLQNINYDHACAFFARNSHQHWAAYIAGSIPVLAQENNIKFDKGISIFIHSSVPIGKGISSSAAVEVATMFALAAALNIPLDPQQLAILCQIVENRIAGAPCGVMDQMTCACGRQGQLMRLLCQPADLQGYVHLPPGIAVWGIDSGIRHAVFDADYASVRIGAFMGLKIISQLSGENFRGYLANVGVHRYENDFADKLPVTITGKDFLARYGPISDTVTSIDTAHTYAVRQPAAHPIYEHARVNKFADLLSQIGNRNSEIGNPDQSTLAELGQLMYQSHASYSVCGLGSDSTDSLVQLVKDAGPSSGLFGAKITGGGSGGTVAILGLSSADPLITQIAQQYSQQTNRPSYIFRNSSPGAAAFGTLQLSPTP